ncbi:MAG: hypothetical protein V3T17_10625 [Pseudomonadales bacterium]
MKNPTPLLPGFHLQTLRRTPRSARQILAEKAEQLKEKSFSQLGECFGKFIPEPHLRPTEAGAQSRRRFFSKENTFWAFFSQVLDADGGVSGGCPKTSSLCRYEVETVALFFNGGLLPSTEKFGLVNS